MFFLHYHFATIFLGFLCVIHHATAAAFCRSLSADASDSRSFVANTFAFTIVAHTNIQLALYSYIMNLNLIVLFKCNGPSSLSTTTTTKTYLLVCCLRPHFIWAIPTHILEELTVCSRVSTDYLYAMCFYVMLCFAMLCCVVLCYAMLSDVRLCYAFQYYVMFGVCVCVCL